MNKLLLNIKPKSQWFPYFYLLGCEAVAVSMALKYKGVRKSARTILSEIPKHDTNPYKGYVGPKRVLLTYKHQTVFPNVMADYINDYYPAEDATGATMSELELALMNNHPVVIYATYGGITPKIREFLVEGMKRPFVSNIHIRLLVGYDDHYYYLIDPLWARFFGFIYIPAFIPMKQQLMKVSKSKWTKQYDNAGRMCIIF